MSIIITISKDYTRTPGARFKTDGPFSGEEFREKFLEPLFANKSDNSKIIVNLDGTEGYATSFLEEAFGGIARKFGIKQAIERFEFISNEDKPLIDEIKCYMEQCNDTE